MSRAAKSTRAKARAKTRKSSRARPSNRLAMTEASQLLRYPWAYSAGTFVSKDTALSVPALYACIWRITNAIAPHPWKTYEIASRNRIYRPDDRMAWLLNTRPNPTTTAVAFRQALLSACMAGDGNAYAEIQRDQANNVIALWPLEPERVIPHSDSAGMWYEVRQYSGGSVQVEAERIYHLRGNASVLAMVGDSTLSRATASIGISLSAQTFAGQYYANGTISSGVLKHPKTLKAGSIKRLREEWLELHSGLKQSHMPIFLEEGMEWQSIAVDAEKSQLQVTRAFGVEECARFFGVPLHLLGVAQSAQGYGTNVEQLGIEFVRYTLASWCCSLCQEADVKLFPGRAPWRETRIDLSSLTHGDAKTQAEAFAVLKKAGIVSQNEIREELGMNTVGAEGDVYTVETTVQPVERMMNPPEPPAPKALPAANEPSVARKAAAAIYAGAFLRHARRVEKDMPRDRSLVKLEQECQEAIEFALAAGLKAPNGALMEFAACVEHGEPAREVAHRMLSTLEASP